MKPIATRDEMQAIDAYSIHEIGIPGMVLMEKASMALYDEVRKHLHHHSRCLIVVEKGNNGGDGLALARLLHEADYDVTIYEIGGIRKASDSYEAQKNILTKLGIFVKDQMPEEHFDVIVDGIFGVGLTREVKGIQRQVIERLNVMDAYRIAIDVPSGVDGTTGQVLGVGFMADLTVTFGLSKIGLLLYPGASFAGEVIVKEIGFPKLAVEKAGCRVFCYEPGDEKYFPKRKSDSHKGTFGRVLIIAGSKNMAGAAYLSAFAAYRTGSGLVRIFTQESNRVILQTKLPEAILTTYESEVDGADKLRETIAWADAICFGPGMGTGRITRSFLHILKECAKVSVVLDADGLNEISKMEQEGEDYFAGYPVPVILTPHMLEMSRLSGHTVAQLKEDRMNLAETYAKRKNLVLVLKDSRTVVTDGDAIYLNSYGNSGMATGGSGDVLTGILAGALAAGMEPFDAASMAVFLHSRAGDFAAEQMGEHSLMAGDIIKQIEKALGGKQDGRRERI
ncbi:MAG: NAD(P)H-hydrate dehydratase [Lachnospiraceae bacterium]|nr:NAD(P)H-hydrate dehydratase [Lachnospiraceae bacterium]